jgi:20S proteasome alpha/beta subunit
MGSGGLFARYLLNRLHDEDHPTSALTMDEAIREAVYVIEEVKKVDLWCGGPTQLICLTHAGKLERKKPAEVVKIAGELAKLDREVRDSQRKLFSLSLSQKATD